MINGFEEFQRFGKDNVDVALKSASAVGKGCQAFAVEAADFSRKSFAAGSTAYEKMLAAQTLDKWVEIQSDFVRTAYQDCVGQVTKFGEIFSGMAKEAYKPYESYFGKRAK